MAQSHPEAQLTEQQERSGVILDTRFMGQEAEHVRLTDSGLDQQLLAQVWRSFLFDKYIIGRSIVDNLCLYYSLGI